MKKPTITKSLIALLLFFSPVYLFSQTFVGTATSVPADNAAQAGPTPGVITPPAGTQAGDLVVIFGQYRLAGTTILMNATGGQTWNTLAQNSGSTQSTYVFWCTFNGTWTGGGPSIKIAAGTNGLTSVMYAFHASHPNNTWSINVTQAIAGTAVGASHNINGVTTTVPHTVTMAFWASAFQNTWSPTGGTLPAGWSKTNISSQYRNTLAAGQQSNSAAYNIQTTTSGATGNISQDEAGTPTAARTTIVSWNESPVNDNCVDAINLPVSSSYSPTAGTLYSATVQGTVGACGSQKDVWYKFVVPSDFPVGNPVTVSATLTNTAAVPANNLTTGNTSFELFSAVGNLTTCTATTAVAGGCQNISAPRIFTNLTAGSTYYIRLITTVATPNNNATFDISVVAPAGSRMNEVFKQAIVDNGTMNTPWEVTYGPDGFLWVTASKDYKAYRIDPNPPYTKTQILDLSNLTGDPTLKVQFNNLTQNPWPQGGFAGLAIDPNFNTNHYVYISYSLRFDSTGASNAACGFFRNSLVRFTYSAGTLGSGVVICDTLPGGNDHNSQRIIIAPVNGTNYLFYGQGDMGAGQLVCRLRPNHAQDTTYYEGKILRFNIVPDPSEGAYDQWIPNNNPYNKPGKQSAVWAIGIRNNQGFAYNPSTGRLYGSSHGPYSDDEINIIERYKNYGHPLVEGYSADGNYNGNYTAGFSNSITAGETFATTSGNSTLAPIGDEQHNVDSINLTPYAHYKDPLFSGYPSGGPGYPVGIKTVAAIWGNTTKPGNGGWPSEAWSGMDVYTNSMIPGWKNSLLVCGLKWGRVLRLKLNATGDTVVQTNGADTVVYWQGQSRYRDIAFAPNGRDVFVSIDGSGNASGPAGVTAQPTVTKCNNCVIKYTFLGYLAGSGNRSTIPISIDIAPGIADSFQTANKVVINATNNNNNLWVPITDTNSNVVAEINARGYNLDTITTTLLTRTGASRSSSGLRYVNRNITIKPQQQPADSVWIRLYISKAEFDRFVTDGGAGAIGQLKILKNEDSAKKTIASPTTLVNTTISEAFNGTNYVLQGTIGEFSSFYFSNTAIIPLPLNLLTFKGSLQNSATLLEWETSDEVNTSKFLVERSTDGRNFQQIGTVLAAGNSSVKNRYSFTDYDVTRQSSSVVYYRLKMVDNDDAYKYSSVVTITLPDMTSRVALFPNPAAHEVNVTITTAVDGKVKWQLIDNAGRIVNHSSIAAKKGNNNIVINLNRLSTGTYFLIVSGADIDQKVKLEKL